jgi:hypothetical protein
MPFWRRLVGGGARLALRILLALALLWCAAALWYDGPASRTQAGLLAAGIGLAALAVLFSPRPFRRAGIAGALLFAIVLGWWLSIPPRADRDWLPDVARTPRTLRDGDRITIENVRNFRYRSETDFDEIWETREIDLSKLVGADLFLITWGAPGIAHTIVSWEFSDGPPISVSIETRKERGEEYSAVRGFFRQFELYYVVADERDVIGVRTNYPGQRTYLYRIRVPAERARALLLDYLEEINRLAEQPRWYNALIHNCTTAIRYHGQHIGEGRPWDWRILLNGRLDEMAYERGRLDTSLPFPELKARSEITEKAKAAFGDLAFSRRIREGLPDPRTPSRQ